MYSTLALTLSLLLWAISVPSIHAQSFDSGSRGTEPINVTTETPPFDVPPDGIFHATTITVGIGATMRFNRNAANTPIYLLATGDIQIDGTIDISGEHATSIHGGLGGPGGFDGGGPNIGGTPSSGFGPGGGLGGSDFFEADSAGGGAYGGVPGDVSERDGAVYGSSLLIPLVGGSGGGGKPAGGGGGGGGAIVLASNTKVTINGAIVAAGGRGTDAVGNGANDSLNQGSGGAIRIVTPVVEGTGRLDVSGGFGRDAGGHGRIRIDTIDRRGFSFDVIPRAAVATGALLTVFFDTDPSRNPRLDIISAAGRTIDVGTANPVLVLLPLNTPSSQSITVQARNFVGLVPIEIVLTPESGNRIVHAATIDMGGSDTAQVTMTVQFPVNTPTHVNAWTNFP